jgi:SNF2 family DNA or RNA helicase
MVRAALEEEQRPAKYVGADSREVRFRSHTFDDHGKPLMLRASKAPELFVRVVRVQHWYPARVSVIERAVRKVDHAGRRRIGQEPAADHQVRKIFDGVQATKNPEILVTRAAKALQARFKLLATGTPVENSLLDFWCLMDTAQPSLLGSWADFREAWAAPMEAASGEDHARLGRGLRDAVGPFMLRRVKEDHLADLPPKQVHEYPTQMPHVQRDAYDDVLVAHRARQGVRGAALKTPGELQRVSLHPGLVTGPLDRGVAAIDQSARTLVTVRQILDQVRRRDEKAIVFAKTKEIQRILALWLGELFGLRVDVVNGDTAATGIGDTRLSRIRAFEQRAGFNVIVMSPLAVGVGLTVVGANHAIHLERHWNPAKEAQATDRVYRIGQTRHVHVHYPIALHPDFDSFDLNLDRLLRGKVALKDAVVVPQEVSQGELEVALGLI